MVLGGRKGAFIFHILFTSKPLYGDKHFRKDAGFQGSLHIKHNTSHTKKDKNLNADISLIKIAILDIRRKQIRIKRSKKCTCDLMVSEKERFLLFFIA